MLTGDVSEAATEKWLKPTFLRLEPRLELKSGGSDGKESACNAGGLCSIPGSGRSPGEGNGNPLQDSSLENPGDGGAWWAPVHSVAQSWTQLKRLSMHACIGEGNGNPFQYSCLENLRDRGAWWAAVYGVTQSRTRLK